MCKFKVTLEVGSVEVFGCTPSQAVRFAMLARGKSELVSIKDENDREYYRDMKHCEVSIHNSLNVGDLVKEEVITFLVANIPPRRLTADLFQVGEPYGIDSLGRATWLTFSKVNGYWMYRGICIYDCIEEAYK